MKAEHAARTGLFSRKVPAPGHGGPAWGTEIANLPGITVRNYGDSALNQSSAFKNKLDQRQAVLDALAEGTKSLKRDHGL